MKKILLMVVALLVAGCSSSKPLATDARTPGKVIRMKTEADPVVTIVTSNNVKRIVTTYPDGRVCIYPE